MQINVIDVLEEDLKLNVREIRKLQMQDPFMRKMIDFKEKWTTGEIEIDNDFRKKADNYKLF